MLKLHFLGDYSALGSMSKFCGLKMFSITVSYFLNFCMHEKWVAIFINYIFLPALNVKTNCCLAHSPYFSNLVSFLSHIRSVNECQRNEDWLVWGLRYHINDLFQKILSFSIVLVWSQFTNLEVKGSYPFIHSSKLVSISYSL